MCMVVTQSCPTLNNPMDCSPPGPSVHGILRVRIGRKTRKTKKNDETSQKQWGQLLAPAL